MDRLSELPIDIFIKHITYLPRDDVISLCSINKKLYNYCTNYNIQWKALINNTFSSLPNYNKKLIQIWKDLGYKEDKYDYLIYTELLIELLDPITQGMIYFKQKDLKSFHKLKKEEQYLALFLLGQKDIIKEYLPVGYNQPYNDLFIDHLNGKKDSPLDLSIMLLEMAGYGSLQGFKYFERLGADIHIFKDYSLIRASRGGHLDIVKHLVEKGANIHTNENEPLYWARSRGHTDVVKYLESLK